MLDQGVLPAEIYQTQPQAAYFKQLSRNCFFLLEARQRSLSSKAGLQSPLSSTWVSRPH